MIILLELKVRCLLLIGLNLFIFFKRVRQITYFFYIFKSIKFWNIISCFILTLEFMHIWYTLQIIQDFYSKTYIKKYNRNFLKIIIIIEFELHRDSISKIFFLLMNFGKTYYRKWENKYFKKKLYDSCLVISFYFIEIDSSFSRFVIKLV